MTDRNTGQVYTLLGLCMRAGKLANGEQAVEAAVGSGNAKLVLIAEDASPGTKKQLTDKCSFYKTEYRFFGKMEELGNAIGKHVRAAVAVNDEGLAGAVRKKMDAEQTGVRRKPHGEN